MQAERQLVGCTSLYPPYLPTQACRRNQRLLTAPRPLTVRHVYTCMRGLATGDRGAGSHSRRQQQVAGLLRACREEETR